MVFERRRHFIREPIWLNPDDHSPVLEPHAGSLQVALHEPRQVARRGFGYRLETVLRQFVRVEPRLSNGLLPFGSGIDLDATCLVDRRVGQSESKATNEVGIIEV